MQSWLTIGDKAYCDDLRFRLCALAFQQDDAYKLIDLLRFLLDQRELERMKQILFCGNATSVLASFGIHRCSGCGGDYALYQHKNHKECQQCHNSGWMHEIENGVTYFAPGMLDVPKHYQGEGAAKWKLRWKG